MLQDYARKYQIKTVAKPLKKAPESRSLSCFLVDDQFFNDTFLFRIAHFEQVNATR